MVRAQSIRTRSCAAEDSPPELTVIGDAGGVQNMGPCLLLLRRMLTFFSFLVRKHFPRACKYLVHFVVMRCAERRSTSEDTGIRIGTSRVRSLEY